jgi:uncharacterized membrane protein
MLRLLRATLVVASPSALALSLLALRIERSGRFELLFLVKNLVLAWIPLALALGIGALAARRRLRSAALLGVPFALFFPNAFYLVTDIVHLRERGAVPLWFDATLLLTFGFAGTALALASLGVVHHAVERCAGPRWGWLTALGVALASGYGIYLGRIERSNSWDVVTAPRVLFESVTAPLLRPDAHLAAWLITAVFGGLLAALHALAQTGGAAWRFEREEA